MALTKTKKISISISTSGYCKARSHLSTLAIKNLTKNIAIKNEQRISSQWMFRDKNIYLIDGTTITMADTVFNQKEYLLCSKKHNTKTIKNLYKERWHIEVDFRNIKITLNLKEFKCKSPKMVIPPIIPYQIRQQANLLYN